MNFTCNGVIVGYTAALSMRNQSGDQDPIIQVWRKNQSHPGSYYRPNTSVGIAIDNASCVGGLTEVSSEVFHCNLNQTKAHGVSVQPGDILGLTLPNGDDDDIRLAFASVTSGPTNYVFSTEELSSSITLGSSPNSSSMVQELPQISLEIGSSQSERVSYLITTHDKCRYSSLGILQYLSATVVAVRLQ